MEKSYIVCFDFGGSAIKTALCTRNGTILTKASYPIGDHLEDFLNTITSYITHLQNMYCIEGIAISSCGAVDADTGYIHGISAIPFIHGPNWKDLIYKRTGLFCEIENDANCAALSQLYFGEAKHIQNMAFMVIGTGIGGAIVKNRKIHHGAHLYGGEFGMMLVKDENGQFVNFSSIASTSSMVLKMEKRQPDQWDGERIFASAEVGNQDCMDVIQTFYENIAFGVFNIQHMLDPELILFGGGISARNDFTTQVMLAYDVLCTKLDFEPLRPNIACCTYLQDANLLGALANYIQRRPI